MGDALWKYAPFFPKIWLIKDFIKWMKFAYLTHAVLNNMLEIAHNLF